MRQTTCALVAAALLAAFCGCQSMPMLEQPGPSPPVMNDAMPIPYPAVEGEEGSVIVESPEAPVITEMPGTVMGDPGVPYNAGGYCDGGCGGYDAYGHPVPRCQVGLYGRNMHHAFRGPQGPPVGQVTYPYYILRGPRDFLIDNPPSIGP